jgi:hypothetical protein
MPADAEEGLLDPLFNDQLPSQVSCYAFVSYLVAGLTSDYGVYFINTLFSLESVKKLQPQIRLNIEKSS